jgi:hypothetical protein
MSNDIVIKKLGCGETAKKCHFTLIDVNDDIGIPFTLYELHLAIDLQHDTV